MERNNQEEILRNYLERVVALQNEQRQALQMDDLKGIAREIGMSDDDMMAADRAVEGYIERGLRHGLHGRWDDAIRELSDAVALNPANLRALYGLAAAHKERWMAAGNADDRLQAAQLARQCLQLYPDHDQSYVLLNELDSSRNAAESRPRQSERRRAPWFALIPFIIGLAAIAWVFFTDSDPVIPEPPPPPLPPASIAPPEEQGTGTGSGTGINPSLLAQGIPITWLGKQEEGVGLELREIHNEVGTTRRLQLLIDNTGDVALSSLDVVVDDYDSYGLKLSSTKLTLLSEEDSPISPKTFRTTYLEYPVTGSPATYKVSILEARTPIQSPEAR